MVATQKRDFARVVKRTEVYSDPPERCSDEKCRAPVRDVFFVGARGCLCARCAMEGVAEDRKMKFIRVSMRGASVFKRVEV